MSRAILATMCAGVCLGLVGCGGRQIQGWYPASLDADIKNYEGIVAASTYEPEATALAAMQTLGTIARARYRLDHLSANEADFERAPTDWDRMTLEVLSAYGIASRLASLPIERLARGERDPEIAAGLAELRRVVGWWGGAPTPTKGTTRIRP